MSRRKNPVKNLTPEAHQQADELYLAKASIFLGFLLLVFVIVGDVLFYCFTPRSNGHLLIPSLVLGMQFVPIGFLIIAAINFRYASRRLKSFKSHSNK